MISVGLTRDVRDVLVVGSDSSDQLWRDESRPTDYELKFGLLFWGSCMAVYDFTIHIHCTCHSILCVGLTP